MEEKQEVRECRFCGGHFQEMLSKCPYCGSTNIKGAEAEYMKKLEGVRKDMEGLSTLPMQETKKAAKKTGAFLVITAVIIAIILLGIAALEHFVSNTFVEERDIYADYAWEEEHFPQFDVLYEQGNDAELVRAYRDAISENRTIWRWEHYEYVAALFQFALGEEIWMGEKEGYELDPWQQSQLLYLYFRVEEYENSTAYTKEEKERLAPYIEKVREDAASRWKFSEEEWDEIRKEISRPSGDSISPIAAEKFMKKYLKENK